MMLDVGLEPLAVEVHTSSVPPWVSEALYDRALWLLTHGWALAYLWLREGGEFAPEGVDTLTKHYHRQRANPVPSYVVSGPEGQRLHNGQVVLTVERAFDWPKVSPARPRRIPADPPIKGACF